MPFSMGFVSGCLMISVEFPSVVPLDGVVAAEILKSISRELFKKEALVWSSPVVLGMFITGEL